MVRPLTAVAGTHVGCYELVAHNHVRSIAALKGRTVGWSPSYSSSKDLVALMTKLVGLDPDKDIQWVDDRTAEPMALYQTAECLTLAWGGRIPESTIA